MKKKIYLLLCLLFVLAFTATSCKDEGTGPIEEILKKELQNNLAGEWVNIRPVSYCISPYDPDDPDPLFINDSIVASVYFGKDTIWLLREYIVSNTPNGDYKTARYDTLLYKVTGENVIKTCGKYANINDTNGQISGVVFLPTDTLLLVDFYAIGIVEMYYTPIVDVIFYRRSNNEKE